MVFKEIEIKSDVLAAEQYGHRELFCIVLRWLLLWFTYVRVLTQPQLRANKKQQVSKI